MAATVFEVVSDILKRINLRLTDDSRISMDHVWFVAQSVTSKVIAQKQELDERTRGKMARFEIDPSLLQEYTLTVDETGTATLPVFPIRLPYDNGIQNVLIFDPKSGLPRSIMPSTFNAVQVGFNVCWWDIPRYVRVGSRLQFFNIPPLAKVKAYLLSTEFPPDGSPLRDRPFPAPAELLEQIKQETTQIILGAYTIAPDTVADGKDIPNR